MICKNLSYTPSGNLAFAGQDTASLAAEYGTPLYLMDEDRIRENCRTYTRAMKKAFGDGGYRAIYASKAASFKQLYRVMREEGMGVDLVSAGEIFTAKEAGFPMENAFYHSNNKTDADISFALDANVGFFVVDQLSEIYALEKLARQRGITQKILLRLTPGIDPHTFEAVCTGQVDSKFGFAIETGQAKEALSLALSLPHLDVTGFHCHVGSQVFDSEVYLKSAEVMLNFVKEASADLKFTARILDLGGGYGVRYTEDQPTVDVGENILTVAAFLKETCKKLNLPLPVICLEPGRSIVADAGMTLYTVGGVKEIPGYKTYVSVDGGMTDNPRFALYGARYTVLPVKAFDPCSSEKIVADIAGRCCESGDILQKKVPLPASTARGDLLAFLTTGAYNYSMASNYNRVPRPPIVMLKGGTSYLAVRRETLADLTSLDL